MREIKFRAWDAPRKELHDWCWLKDCMYQSTHWDEVEEDYKFMQYTGLKDKNGVEIYEGDIVCDPNCAPDDPVMGTVIFDQSAGMWVFDSIYSTEQLSEWDVEVIGNIHENPELLERE